MKNEGKDPGVAKVDGMDGDRGEEVIQGGGGVDHDDVEEGHIERRDTIRRVEWPGKEDGIAEDNLDNT